MDKRFEDRLGRIETRARSGAKAELLAGVGDVRVARENALAANPVSASLITTLAGAGLGVYCSIILQDVELPDSILVPSIDDLIALFSTYPIQMVAALIVIISVFLAVTSFVRGRRAARMLGFSCALIGAFAGGVITALM